MTHSAAYRYLDNETRALFCFCVKKPNVNRLCRKRRLFLFLFGDTAFEDGWGFWLPVGAGAAGDRARGGWCIIAHVVELVVSFLHRPCGIVHCLLAEACAPHAVAVHVGGSTAPFCTCGTSTNSADEGGTTSPTVVEWCCQHSRAVLATHPLCCSRR